MKAISTIQELLVGFENEILLMYTLDGVSSVANFIPAYEESQSNQDSHFLICNVFYVSKGNLFDVYFTSLQLMLVRCGGRRTSPHVLHQNAVYFISFGIVEPIVVSLKTEFCSCIR